MKLKNDEGEWVSLLPENKEVFATPLIGKDTKVAELYSGKKSIDAFAQELEDYFDDVSASANREELESERVRRGCLAKELFLNAPLVPDITCL